MAAYVQEHLLPWYAVYVKHKHEKKVATTLSAKAMQTFVPTVPRTHSNGSCFEVPLFPGYIFCRLDIATPLPIISTPGVFGIVFGSSTSGSIPDDEIDSVRKLLLTGFPVTPSEYYSPGQEVFLNEGPLRGIRGTVIDATNERWLVVSINIMRRSVAVKLNPYAATVCN